MSLMNEICEVWRYKKTKDSLKVETSSFDKILSSRCKFVQSISSIIQGEKAVINSEYSLYLPKNTDILEGDIVKIDGFNYRAARPQKLKTHTKVNCIEEGAL